MKSRFAICLLSVTAGVFAADGEAPAPSVEQVIAKAVDKNRRCLVSSDLETTSNLATDIRSQQIARNGDNVEFRRGDCPSAEKKQVEIQPVGR